MDELDSIPKTLIGNKLRQLEWVDLRILSEHEAEGLGFYSCPECCTDDFLVPAGSYSRGSIWTPGIILLIILASFLIIFWAIRALQAGKL